MSEYAHRLMRRANAEIKALNEYCEGLKYRRNPTWGMTKAGTWCIYIAESDMYVSNGNSNPDNPRVGIKAYLAGSWHRDLVGLEHIDWATSKETFKAWAGNDWIRGTSNKVVKFVMWCSHSPWFVAKDEEDEEFEFLASGYGFEPLCVGLHSQWEKVSEKQILENKIEKIQNQLKGMK